MIHFEGAAALRRLLDSGDRLSLHCADDDVFHPFGDRRRALQRGMPTPCQPDGHRRRVHM